MAFGKLSYISKDKDIHINLKCKVYDSCVLRVAMLGITIRDKIRNHDIRNKTKVTHNASYECKTQVAIGGSPDSTRIRKMNTNNYKQGTTRNWKEFRETIETVE